jgi:hypothetical protein
MDDPRSLPAKTLGETLVAILSRCQYGAEQWEWDVIQEAQRRLREHERLLRDILPELRNRLSAAEDR